jgi:uncharacterized membrane protein HdeD (DUF308 family)
MNAGPQYQRSELRVEPGAQPDVLADERRVSTARTSRFSPAAIVAGIGGIVLIVLGLIAVARGGLSGPLTEPVVDVVGFSHTPLLGLIEAGTGLILFLCALWGTRASTLFVGVLVAIAGIVVAAAPDAFASSLATESSYGVFLIVLGGIVALTSLLIPDRSSRVVTYR